jgi:hypothetical protein
MVSSVIIADPVKGLIKPPDLVRRRLRGKVVAIDEFEAGAGRIKGVRPRDDFLVASRSGHRKFPKPGGVQNAPTGSYRQMFRVSFTSASRRLLAMPSNNESVRLS